MKLHEIINNEAKYIGKLIYRQEWDKFYPHRALRVFLTNVELVYVPSNKNEKIEVFDSCYKFSAFEVLCDDWEIYEEVNQFEIGSKVKIVDYPDYVTIINFDDNCTYTVQYKDGSTGLVHQDNIIISYE